MMVELRDDLWAMLYAYVRGLDDYLSFKHGNVLIFT